MDRLGFLKSLGIAALVPSVLVPDDLVKHEELAIKPTKLKRWPIYPEYNHFAYKRYENIYYEYIAYVKILREGIEYLVLVRESGVNSNENTKKRFENSVKMVKELCVIGDNYSNLEILHGIVIKYDEHMHNSNEYL